MQIELQPTFNMFEAGGISLSEAEKGFLNNVASGGQKDSFSQVVASIYAGRLLAKYAQVLNHATWALVFTTAVLVVVTLISAFK